MPCCCSAQQTCWGPVAAYGKRVPVRETGIRMVGALERLSSSTVSLLSGACLGRLLLLVDRLRSTSAVAYLVCVLSIVPRPHQLHPERNASRCFPAHSWRRCRRASARSRGTALCCAGASPRSRYRSFGRAQTLSRSASVLSCCTAWFFANRRAAFSLTSFRLLLPRLCSYLQLGPRIALAPAIAPPPGRYLSVRSSARLCPCCCPPELLDSGVRRRLFCLLSFHAIEPMSASRPCWSGV